MNDPQIARIGNPTDGRPPSADDITDVNRRTSSALIPMVPQTALTGILPVPENRGGDEMTLHYGAADSIEISMAPPDGLEMTYTMVRSVLFAEWLW